MSANVEANSSSFSELATLQTTAPRTVGRQLTSFGTLFMSTFVCVGVTVSLITVSDSFVHWFVIPLTLCGIVIGIDAVDWARGRLGVLDPIGIIGLVGFHFFFLAPALHVLLGYWMRYIVPPPEWRDWLGYMAGLNLAGLVLYRWSRSWSWGFRAHRLHTHWRINAITFPVIMVFALMLSGVLQIFVFASYGGIGGYVTAATQVVKTAFVGTGWILTISESFPVLALIGVTVWLHGRRRRPSWLVVALILLAFFVLQFLFGGLRGSRSNTIWAMFWAVGLVYLWLRPVSRKVLVAGVLVLIGFMYLYGFYKAAGVNGVIAFQDPLQRVQIEQTSNRSLTEVILGDLGRADVQAYLLYRLTSLPHDYDLALGRSYLGDLALLIPRQVWADRPPTKVRYGTDALYGNGAFAPGVFEASNVYGLAGEAMLNFGPVGAPVSFVGLGVLVAAMRWFNARLDPDDARVLLVPIGVCFCLVVLISDLDNDLFFLFKFVAVPLLVVALGSRRIRKV